MGNALLSDIGQDTKVKNSHVHGDLMKAGPLLFDDGLSISFYFAKYDEHYSEIV